jgi:FMN-dependent oxidoreductase (nitrilotriacetate monooxygenase family)
MVRNTGSGHQSPGLWTHPDDHSPDFNDLNHWVELAKMLEEAKFHGMFIADVLGGYDVYNGDLTAAARSGAQWPVNEPLSVVSAMAAATKNLGFGVTISTTYEQPYHLARRLSTADHLTKGRLGWNIVTGYLNSAARNLGMKEQPQHDDRYTMCEEYIQVIYKLLESSWRDDAVVLDRVRRVYSEPSRIREINHEGRFYKVPGPHICQPSPQRTPLLLQAGTSSKGKEFAARHAEAVFVSVHSPQAVAGNIKNIRDMAKGFGRDPQSIKFLAMMCPIVAPTDEEAQAKYEELKSYGSLEGAMALFGGWTGINLADYEDDEEIKKGETPSNAIRSRVEEISKAKTRPGEVRWTKGYIANHTAVGGMGPVFVGSPATVADEMERWVAEADVDGFNMVIISASTCCD